LLKDWGLLEETDHGRLRTTFPVLGDKATVAIRGAMKETALAIVPQIRDDVTSLSKQLQPMQVSSAYTILFTYVLDQLVWDVLERKRAVRELVLTPDHPFWDGVLWAFKPRPLSLGTNSIANQGTTLKMMWAPEARSAMGPLVSDRKNFRAMFMQLSTQNRVVDPQLKAIFGSYGILDPDGLFKPPVIVEDAGNALYTISHSLAERVGAEVLQRMDRVRVKRAASLRSEEQALVIGYHELMWELLDALEKEGLVRRPRLLSDPKNAEHHEVADLLVMIRRTP
jgi:hypothetical protein